MNQLVGGIQRAETLYRDTVSGIQDRPIRSTSPMNDLLVICIEPACRCALP